MGDKNASVLNADDGTSIGTEQPKWKRVVLVCSKCMKRQQRENLRGDLKRALKSDGYRDIRVVACGCLDLCPKRGVTVALGNELASPVPRLRVLDRDDRAETLLPLITSG